jgi:hypothetical protein
MTGGCDFARFRLNLVIGQRREFVELLRKIVVAEKAGHTQPAPSAKGPCDIAERADDRRAGAPPGITPPALP